MLRLMREPQIATDRRRMTKPTRRARSAAAPSTLQTRARAGSARRRLALRSGLALIAGVVHSGAFAPLNLWWLEPMALAALLYLACAGPGAHLGRWQAGLVGVAFGFGWYVTGVYWVFISMHHYGGMPAPIAGAALVLFALYLGAFCGGALALSQPSLRRAFAIPSARSVLGAALLFGAAWGAGEMLRGYLLTGFPWLSSGYAHIDGPLASLAPIVGVYGIGAFGAVLATGLALFLASASTRGALLAATACAALPLALGVALAPLYWAHETGETLRVRLLQGNVAQQLKFDPERSIAAMQAYASAIQAVPADLVVLPETAWTVPWSRTPRPIVDSIEASLRRQGGVAAIGMPLPARTADGSLTFSNSVAAIGGEGPLPWRYDKRHLVPFGEFVPVGFRWFVDLMHIPLGDFARGAAHQPALEVRGQRLAFNICYEDIFGDELAPQVQAGATILVNISNIAWFGDSRALPQHLQIARMRAMELARPMLRATNTGVTAAIDPRGRVVAALPPYTEEALTVQLRGTTGLTPYARAGDYAPLALIALMAALAVAASRPPSRPR